MPYPPSREPNGQTYWCGGELDPDGNQVWFRITARDADRPPPRRGLHQPDA